MASDQQAVNAKQEEELCQAKADDPNLSHKDPDYLDQSDRFDAGSQSRFHVNHVARVDRLLVESMNAGCQSQLRGFFGRGQSTATAKKEGGPDNLVDLED
jgi:hypothetical protein